MDESLEVIAVVGPLASGVAQVGDLLTDLPAGVSSADLDVAVGSVWTTAAPGVTAHLLTADLAPVSMRLFTVLAEDGGRRYLIGVLAPEVGWSELGRLRRNDQVYEMWFERAPTGVCLVSIAGSFLRANPAYCRLVGRAEHELLSLTFQDITHPDDLLLDVSLVDDVLAGRIDRYEMDKRYVRPDGSVVWVHLTVALLRDERGSPLHFISMLEDISERKDVQDRLTVTLELWRTLFELSPLATAELALDGTVLRANDAAGRLLGCTPEELIGQRTPDLGDPADAADTLRSLSQFAAGDVSRPVVERSLLDSDGRLRWVSVHTAAVSAPAGRIDRLVVQAIDVTEARELREQLQRTVAELSIAYREKVALMAALSHDLRTPLATIRILAGLLVASGPSSSERAPDLARRLLAEAARTEEVLGDLVSAERAPAGSITAHRVPTALNALVRRVVDVEADQRTSHQIHLVLGDGECTVSADPSLVERMVANLISNALRHTPAGSNVWVRVRPTFADQTNVVEIAVDDDGGGVPDVLKEVIFGPYVRASPADRPGSGIGLFLVRRFAEFHGGTVVCEDRPGGGASFRVTLPRG